MVFPPQSLQSLLRLEYISDLWILICGSLLNPLLSSLLSFVESSIAHTEGVKTFKQSETVITQSYLLTHVCITRWHHAFVTKGRQYWLTVHLFAKYLHATWALAFPAYHTASVFALSQP